MYLDLYKMELLVYFLYSPPLNVKLLLLQKTSAGLWLGGGSQELCVCVWVCVSVQLFVSKVSNAFCFNIGILYSLTLCLSLLPL